MVGKIDGYYLNIERTMENLTFPMDFKNYAVSAKFPKFSNKDKPLIIQYATKRFTLPDEDCGGLYIKPEFILNLDVKKPADWDEEWDGEWEPPGMVNPEFKDEWQPREIPNPAYKGEWIHPEIPNPDYVPDPNLYLYEDIGAIGIELWQVNSSTIYDNIIITDSIEEAKLKEERLEKEEL
ncbi:calreticulin family protein [Onchocerca flexuosa]|uniref:Calreticulin family protein n=1 Tax=Onchocerca flexuosa TaxID=387005 RepID=A0A238BLU9_9BILA|nr:calreticulin family protein [Onchocerca flexuosa]